MILFAEIFKVQHWSTSQPQGQEWTSEIAYLCRENQRRFSMEIC
jgi:hypothetical protein